MKTDFTAKAAKQTRANETQIVATLGPATNAYETIKDLWEAGVDTFRLNFSHGSHEDHGKLIDIIRQVEKDVGSPIGILADMQGPKLRIGAFRDDMKVPLTPGKKIRFDLDPTPGDETRVCFPHPDVLAALDVGARFLMDEGYVAMKIVEKGEGYVVAENIFGKQLSGKKGVNVPDLSRRVGTLTPKDMVDMEFALSKGVDWIAQSFVQSAEDVREAKKFIQGRAKLIAKLEKPDAITNLKEIVSEVDAIMVARGDLGVETPQEEVPAAQYAMVTEAIAQNKPVIVATHMFESMITNPRPTRAEVSDVALAVLQGASAVMLSGETSIGKFPVDAVTIMDKTVYHAENNDIHSRKTLKNKVAPPLIPRPSLETKAPAPVIRFPRYGT
ncbi:MAG: pyruvate kinase [Alphaproteobacteria bacterium]|nr:MAG: pyruvate kinase [Alphaproteobacteria bacterium]